MLNDKDLITVTIKSFIPPNESMDSFQPGEPFKFHLPQNTTLEELIRKIFSKNLNQIGIMAVNGQIASNTVVLSQGDKIDLYGLLDGG